MRKQILIVDDDTGVLAALSLFLKQHEFDITAATTPTDALGLIEDCEFSLAILDLNYTRDTTSGLEGLELIGAIRERDAALPIIVMTGWATIDTAVKAMQLGAQDFLEKPWENARLLSIVNNSLALAKSQRVEARLSAENRLLQSASEPATLWATKSPAMQSALKVAERVAPTEVNVLITGSNGTGKSLLARMMHDLSQRSPGPFISVNTSAVPETLFESEMFGHIKGAFTDAREDRLGRFEIADGGTLFLDEVGNIALAQQAKLLRVLESSEFERLGSSRTQRCDVRIISATNADL
ncbi:MAG: sigma-54 dependent transcriptional regulator, partial [Pseudomonadales bacterium]